MKLILRLLLMTGLLAVLVIAEAADTPFEFTKAAHQALYEELTSELRCLVCQNQSLADSHADLAQDLRNEVYRMVEAGRGREDIIRFLVARYGDFVLYDPPLKNTTLLLWFGPFILLALAAFVAVNLVRKRATVEVTALDAAERRKLRALLGERDAEPKP